MGHDAVPRDQVLLAQPRLGPRLRLDLGYFVVPFWVRVALRSWV